MIIYKLLNNELIIVFYYEKSREKSYRKIKNTPDPIRNHFI